MTGKTLAWKGRQHEQSPWAARLYGPEAVVRSQLFGGTAVEIKGTGRASLSEGSPVIITWAGEECRIVRRLYSRGALT